MSSIRLSHEMITLDEAAKLIPGANAATLKRNARAGKLTVYRPGRAYLTTLPDIQRMIEACRADLRGQEYGLDRSGETRTAMFEKLPTSLETDPSKLALDLAREQAKRRRQKR